MALEQLGYGQESGLFLMGNDAGQAKPIAGGFLYAEAITGKIRIAVDSDFTAYEITGASGYSGQVGATGSSGYSGISGKSGYSGTNGASGYSGTNGTNGASGYSGTNGTNGASGYSGQDGYSGYSGIGL